MGVTERVGAAVCIVFEAIEDGLFRPVDALSTHEHVLLTDDPPELAEFFLASYPSFIERADGEPLDSPLPQFRDPRIQPIRRERDA